MLSDDVRGRDAHSDLKWSGEMAGWGDTECSVCKEMDESTLKVVESRTEVNPVDGMELAHKGEEEREPGDELKAHKVRTCEGRGRISVSGI